MIGLMPVDVPSLNILRLEKFSDGALGKPIPLRAPVVVGIVARWLNVNGPELLSFRKWSSSSVDIGCVGYANGSSDGNMIGIRSGRLLSNPGTC